jgi:predicted small secreted protein
MKNVRQLSKRICLVLLLITLVALAGVGCHTANGFGQDMKDAGQGIKNGTQ